MKSTTAKRQTERARKRALLLQKKRMAAAAKAAAAEEKAEAGAPKVQREPVLDRNGNVLRGARLEPDGVTFKRSNPVRHLAARSKNMDTPLVTKAHVDASDRLLIIWEEGSGGISMGASNYGERAGGSVSTGAIADAVLAGIGRQMNARREIAATQAFLGALWPIVFAVVIRGIDVLSYAEAADMNRQVALGYLVAALDRLLELQAPKSERRQRIRSIEIAGMSVDGDVGISQ